MYSDVLKDILVPVDLGVNTSFAVKQAIELTRATGSIIHLLHVIISTERWKSDSFDNRELKKQVNEMTKKLNEWKTSIEETIPGSSVKIHLEDGVVHDCIIETAKKIQPQLIILGSKKKKNFFSFFRPICPNEISRSTHCPVLTVMNNTSNTRIQNIVVPVRSFIPKRKIGLLLVFAKMYRAKIHLVSVLDKMGEKDAERIALLDTYQLLKNGLNNPIEYSLLRTNNFPKATLKYARKINADLIFVNPSSETKVSLLGKHINDLLPSSSGLKFLFVEPYPEEYGLTH